MSLSASTLLLRWLLSSASSFLCFCSSQGAAPNADCRSLHLLSVASRMHAIYSLQPSPLLLPVAFPHVFFLLPSLLSSASQGGEGAISSLHIVSRLRECLYMGGHHQRLQRPFNAAHVQSFTCGHRFDPETPLLRIFLRLALSRNVQCLCCNCRSWALPLSLGSKL